MKHNQIKTRPAGAAGARISGGRDRREDDPRAGFRDFGEFALAVQHASLDGARPDERLLIGAAAPTTYGGEDTGQDGGFAVPQEFALDIFTLALQEDALLPYTDNVEIGGNSMAFPKDETTPWGTDGIWAYWQHEAVAGTPTKPKLGTNQLRLSKLLGLVPVSDELLEDAIALGSYLPGKMADSIRWKTNQAILFGNGNGQPLGALNNNAAVTIAKDSGQATGTLTPTNISNMIARLPAGSFARAVWIMNPDVLPALDGLTVSGYPMYLPPSEEAAKGAYGMLKGRPVLVSEDAKAFSAQGDVLLVDLAYYRTITRPEGIETVVSMHFYFDSDTSMFRVVFRVDGQPKLSRPITVPNSSNKRSPFVQLGAR